MTKNLSCRSLRKLTLIFLSSSMGSLLFAIQNSGVPAHNIRALLHQQFRIGVLCMMQDMLEIAAVHHCSVIQHHDTVCHARNGIQVM